MQVVARFFSWVFLPLFTPIYGLLVVLFIPSVPSSSFRLDTLYAYPIEIKWLFLLLFTVFLVLAPGLSFVVLRYNRTISSFAMEHREERATPISVMAFYFLVLYGFLLFQSNAEIIPAIIKGMALAGGITSFIAYHINKYMKISLHAIGMGALAGFVYTFFLSMESYSLLSLILVFLAGGLVMTARLYLKHHTLKEIGYGYLLGFIIQFIVIFVYQIITS